MNKLIKDCTCPLAWLVFERSLYEEFDAKLNTSSSYKCVQIHPHVFRNYLLNVCEPRVRKCDDDSQITDDSSDYSTDYFTDETIETEPSSSLSSTSRETTIESTKPSDLTSSETPLTTKYIEIKYEDKGKIIGLSVALTVVSIILVIVTIFAIYSFMGYVKLKNFKSDVAYELTSFDKHIDK